MTDRTPGPQPRAPNPQPPALALLTDFGLRDAYVGIMKGVILGICPQARMVDLTHEIDPQDVVGAALLLQSAVGFFPAGTIYLAVVDPGVGSERPAVVVATEGGLLVGPDNGVLSPATRDLGVREVRRIENEALFLHPVSRTFHGRDVFAPVAAHLAQGRSLDDVGPPTEMQQLELPRATRRSKRIDGEVIHVDHFGNLITNIPAAWLGEVERQGLSATIFDVSSIPVRPTYAAVAAGELVALVGSTRRLEIAVRNGSASARLSAGRGAPVTVSPA